VLNFQGIEIGIVLELAQHDMGAGPLLACQLGFIAVSGWRAAR
jgi:hypothetical protein